MRVTRALVCATAAVAPAFLLQLDVGPVHTTLLEVLVVILLITFGLESRITTVRPRWPGAYTGPMLLIGVALLASIATGSDWLTDTMAARTLFLEPALVFGVACSVLATTQHLRRTVGALLLGGTLLAVADLVVVGRAVASQPGALWRPPVARVGLGDSFLLVPLVALALALIISAQGGPFRLRRLPPVVFLAVALPACALSLGRTAWVTLAAIAVAVGAAHLRRRPFLCAVIVAVAVVLTVIPNHSTLGEFSGVHGRTALELWNHTAGTTRRGTVVGPTSLDLAIEVGIAGLGGFLWLSMRALRWLLAIAPRATREHRALAVGAAIAMGAVLLRGLLDNRLLGEDLGMVAAIGGALLAAVARLERVRLRVLARVPGCAMDIEPAELPMPADIPRRTGRHPVLATAEVSGDASLPATPGNQP